MDNLTHTLTGVLLARAGANRLAPLATPALVVAANVADLDYLSRFLGAQAYLQHRYGAAHSLTGAVALGAILALVLWLVARRRRPQRLLLLRLLGVCLLGTFSHGLLDWTTARGATFLWPIGTQRYALDWAPFFDPWLLVVFLLGLGLPMLFRLVGEEIGARQTQVGARRGAWIALVVCVLLAAGRANLHDDAVKRLQARLYRGRAPVRVAAFPAATSPFRWHGVAETERTFEVIEPGAGRSGGEEKATTFYKPEPSPALETALATGSAQLLLEWARFPHAEVSPFGDGWRVRLRDLRYAASGQSSPVRLEIELNQKLSVMKEELRLSSD